MGGMKKAAYLPYNHHTHAWLQPGEKATPPIIAGKTFLHTHDALGLPAR
jgi:hypothetical protein